MAKRVDNFPELKYSYNKFDELNVTEADRAAYRDFLRGLIVEFKNIGGLVMPLIVQLDFDDGSKQEIRIPAEVWRRDCEKVAKLFITDKLVKSLTLDPHLETADTELENNYFPRRIVPSRFQLFKMRQQKRNAMQKRKGIKKK